MTQDYTTYGRDPQPYAGQPNFAVNVAANFQAVDDRLNKHLELSGSRSTDYTLTADDLKSGIIELAWTLGAAVAIKIPITGSADGTRRMLAIFNNTTGAFTLTVKTTAGGSTGVTIDQGDSALVWHDDVNVYPVIGGVTVGGGGVFAATGRVTLAGGTAPVSTAAIAALSDVLLSAQDDNVSGALRVSNRVVGVSFDIVSTNGADSGVVSWAILA